jgi:CHAD domain-containing protein
MNSRSPETREQENSAGKPGRDKGFTEWRRLLARCGRKPTRKRVHKLRVDTLRIQAGLEYRRDQDGHSGQSAGPASRWSKQADKLREALGPVREVDVWMGMLDDLRRSLAGHGEYIPRSNRESLRQIDQLEEKLKERRKDLEKDLVAEIEARRGRMDRISKDVEDAAEAAIPRDYTVGAGAILDQFAAVVSEFPTLDGDNLHEFRKGIKKVRYLAEFFAAGDLEVKQVAVSLRKMQSAIGEWHDWDALARNARHSNGGHGKRGELAELLETLTAESLEKALGVCERITERLLKRSGRAGNSAGDPALKLPVRSEAIAGAADGKKYA